MAASGLTPEELMEAIREHGVATIHEVDLAVLEIDGNISVLSAAAISRGQGGPA